MRRGIRLLTAAVVGFSIVAVLGVAHAALYAEVLDRDELEAEMRRNEALRVQVRHHGYPDLAQRWDVHAELPWDSYIVRLFYLDARTEIAFSRAYALGRPYVGLLRYRRPLSEEMAQQVRQYLAVAPAPGDEFEPGARELGPAERAEAAARRAELAANLTELGALAAEKAVNRLEATASELDKSFWKRLRKK
jgi:hypothetical protein